MKETQISKFEKINKDGRFSKNIKRLKREIDYICLEKEKVDSYVKKLDFMEQNFIYLKYYKNYKMDYIADKLFVSRSQVFRIREKALNNLCDIIEKAYWEVAS